MERQRDAAAGSSRPLIPAELIDRCKRGDERAWRELVESTHREVYTLCLRILGDPHDAAEATQDAFVLAWRGLPRFRGDAQFGTWLYRIATNAAISKHRTRARRRKKEADPAALADVPATGSVEASAETNVDIHRLETALAALPDQYRIPITLRDVYGLSIEEIAQQLGIGESAAKVRVHRARKRLRDALWSVEEGA